MAKVTTAFTIRHLDDNEVEFLRSFYRNEFETDLIRAGMTGMIGEPQLNRWWPGT